VNIGERPGPSTSSRSRSPRPPLLPSPRLRSTRSPRIRFRRSNPNPPVEAIMDSLPYRVSDGFEPMEGYRMWAYALRGRRAQLHSLRSMISFFFHQLRRAGSQAQARLTARGLRPKDR
jgi:hypothetical protein